MSTNKSNEKMGAVNRGVPSASGLCTFCRNDCHGSCETWLSSLAGRATLTPQLYGNATLSADNTVQHGVSYEALRIRGRAFGTVGVPQEQAASGDIAYCDAKLETRVGAQSQTPCRFPFLIGALGHNPVVIKYWESIAIGAALCGIPLVIGENVGGGDTQSRYNANGSLEALPAMDKRIETYRRYHDGHGHLLVQITGNDMYNGVADYMGSKYGDSVSAEVRWGQGAKPIPGEGTITDPEYARFMKRNRYALRPNPDDAEVCKDFATGRITQFKRYSGMTYPGLHSADQVLEAMAAQAAQLRKAGFKYVSMKTGAFGMLDLAVAIRGASELNFDLLSLDGAGAGTGMAPNDVMDAWGVPTVLLHAKAYEYAALRAAAGKSVVHMVPSGGFAKPAQVFKALAMGAPWAAAVCITRAFMIPVFLGCNIEGALHPERRATVNGAWDQLPPSVARFGDTAEAIFAGYHALKERLGADEMKHIPYGAIAMWTFCDRLATGLQQHMGGARKFDVASIDRTDIGAVNRETARETGIDFITEQDDDKAKALVIG